MYEGKYQFKYATRVKIMVTLFTIIMLYMWLNMFVYGSFLNNTIEKNIFCNSVGFVAYIRFQFSVELNWIRIICMIIFFVIKSELFRYLIFY